MAKSRKEENYKPELSVLDKNLSMQINVQN